MSKFTIDASDPEKVVIDSDTAIVANGIEVPAAGDPVEPPSGGTVHPAEPWKNLTGQAFGVPTNSKIYDVPGVYRGALVMQLKVAGQQAFYANVPAGMTAGFRARRVGDERAYWESKTGCEDIVAKIDAMNLPDDAFSVFPHGDGSRKLPFYPVEFKGGEYSELTLTDEQGNQRTYSIANKTPQEIWVFANEDGDRVRHTFN